jgi:hypothetical protein
LPSSLRLEAAVFRSDAVVERSLDGLEDRSFRSLSVRGRFARVSGPGGSSRRSEQPTWKLGEE